MADSLKDVLGKRLPSEPIEFGPIKDFVQARYGVVPKLHLSNDSIVITVPSGALAGSLRMDIYELGTACHTKRRLVIRIGQG